MAGTPEPLGFPRCWRCALRFDDRPRVCARCRAGVSGGSGAGVAAAGRRCPVCGQDFVCGVCPNRWCDRADRAFSVVFATGDYDDALRRALHAYKFAGRRWWAAVFARLLAGELQEHPTWFEEFDLITGMPAYRGAGARRRWDPVGLILAELARQSGETWDVHPGAVVKVAETPRLSGRPRWERERIAQGPLRAALRVPVPQVVAGARVLVVDDLFTEGSSLQEVARVLVTAGAAEVAGLVLGRPVWRGAPAA